MENESEPKVESIKTCDMGRAAYLAFHEARGDLYPTWEDIAPAEQAAWYRAARAAFDHFVDVTQGLRYGAAEG